MASIRRTFSLVPRSGTLMNGELRQLASPLSISSSSSQMAGLVSSSSGKVDHEPYKAQSFLFNLFSRRSSRNLDRSKVKGHMWLRYLFHFMMCFIAGVFVGLTPFVSPNLPLSVMSKHQDFPFDMFHTVANSQLHGEIQNSSKVSAKLPTNERKTLELSEKKVGISSSSSLNNSLVRSLNAVFHKPLIIVTASRARPLQAYYLSRLANTLALVPQPLVWIVVEMTSQSPEIAELLRKTGVMYRHLVCRKNSSEIRDSNVHLRNVALDHIEEHHLDGIVYFTADDNVYSKDIFNQMRQIRWFGTWMVGKLVETKPTIFWEGPICNGSEVIGWHTDDMTKRYRRFHADMSGFAFTSIILWDTARWPLPALESIRQDGTTQEDYQASAFIEKIVRDERQMECITFDTVAVMVWHNDKDADSNPHQWFIKNSLPIVIPLP